MRSSSTLHQCRPSWFSRRAGAYCTCLLLGLRSGAFCFQGLLQNSFKDILNHSIAPHGMKTECFFSFHAGTRVKTLAQQRPSSMDTGALRLVKHVWKG